MPDKTNHFLSIRFALSAPLWSLALAIHLLVVCSRDQKPNNLSRLGCIYCLLCFGIPFGVALAHLRLQMSEGDVVHGNTEVGFPVLSETSTPDSKFDSHLA
jgi:hypothetical protein